MDKCPYCGAETREGDNFCLHCGNRLLPATPSSPVQSGNNEATVAATEDWPNPPPNLGGGWSESNALTVANASSELPTVRDSGVATVEATVEKIERPARFILRSESGDVLQEYPLDKFEITIGRAPNSDILLSKDKLTSRRHATIRYENGEYWLHDEKSANGTFINSQQMDDTNNPHKLQEDDNVVIGEHELVFHNFNTQKNEDNIPDLPTISVENTFRTQNDPLSTYPPKNEYNTQTIPESDKSEEASLNPIVPPPSAVEEPAIPSQNSESNGNVPAQNTVNSNVNADKTTVSTPLVSTPAPTDKGGPNVTFNRLTNLSLPNLPEMSTLMAALSTLDGQVMSLQEQFNSTQEAMRNHDAEIVQTSNQLRTDIRRVSDRMDSTIADVARSREALAWAELLQLMEDVMNNPRDIEYVTKLARKARELNKVFQIHQTVLNTMAECNSLLRSLIGEEK